MAIDMSPPATTRHVLRLKLTETVNGKPPKRLAANRARAESARLTLNSLPAPKLDLLQAAATIA